MRVEKTVELHADARTVWKALTDPELTRKYFFDCEAISDWEVGSELLFRMEVEGQEKLRPGMFASVFLETDVHQDALVIPKAALVLDSIGDTVFIEMEGLAARREVKLGFRESDAVEVLGRE